MSAPPRIVSFEGDFHQKSRQNVGVFLFVPCNSPFCTSHIDGPICKVCPQIKSSLECCFTLNFFADVLLLFKPSCCYGDLTLCCQRDLARKQTFPCPETKRPIKSFIVTPYEVFLSFEPRFLLRRERICRRMRLVALARVATETDTPMMEPDWYV